MDKKRVLFVCVHNSARSQMAEAFLNEIAGERFEAMSAGLEPDILNPFAVEVMREVGIDISRNTTKSVFDLYEKGDPFDYVITVCDEASAEMCPVFPGSLSKRFHWSFEDPSAFEGDYDSKLSRMRITRDAIRTRIVEWVQETA